MKRDTLSRLARILGKTLTQLQTAQKHAQEHAAKRIQEANDNQANGIGLVCTVNGRLVPVAIHRTKR